MLAGSGAQQDLILREKMCPAREPHILGAMPLLVLVAGIDLQSLNFAWSSTGLNLNQISQLPKKQSSPVYPNTGVFRPLPSKDKDGGGGVEQLPANAIWNENWHLGRTESLRA